MKKRFRKKLKKGEFTEFGFEITINFSESAKDTHFDEWLDKFIKEIDYCRFSDKRELFTISLKDAIQIVTKIISDE